MSNRYKGGVISATAPTASASAASGMWTLDQAMQLEQQNLWPNRAPSVIGQAFGGGFYAGAISTSANSVATHYLIVGPVASAQSLLEWQPYNTATAGADSEIDGPQNTADMIAAGNSTDYPSAHFCNDLSTGGQTDWYMPARNELEVCYYNLKPTTTSNYTSSGINANAVPARASSYTSGDPAQTTVALFITSTGAEAFDTGGYWSSTEQSASIARRQIFGYGYAGGGDFKSGLRRVRAVRRIAV